MITPEQLAKSGTEHGEQAALFCWANQMLRENPKRYEPLRWMFAIPNGGERHIAVASKLKAEGVKTGVSDIFLPHIAWWDIGRDLKYAGLFIEMKANDNKARLTKEQSEFGFEMNRRGYRFEACFGWQAAVEVIEKYLG